jgi:tellurite methyltransferase
MIRTIDRFHQDDEGDWVAELSCLHNQHVRHQPPFRDRLWVTTETGRGSRVGADLDCPLCDRAELPAGLERVRTAGPFDADNLPAALQRAHVVADRTWGRLRVLEGSVKFTMETLPRLAAQLPAGTSQPIPPGVAHALEVGGPVRLAVDFLVPTSAKGTGSAAS